MRTWEEALKEHRAAVLAAGFKEENIVGIFTYGSQNYGVATETSDWDTKAIIVPSYEELVLRPPVSREIHLENGEHCEVKDIREIVNMFKKQNINFLEILYTEYKWLNPIYKRQWEIYFEENREIIIHYDTNKTVKSICGQAIHTLKQNPTDGKKVANGLRLLRFLENFLAGVNYSDCIVLPEEERQRIINLKTGKIMAFKSYSDNFIVKFDILRNTNFEKDEKQMQLIEKKMQEGIFAIFDIMVLRTMLKNKEKGKNKNETHI